MREPARGRRFFKRLVLASALATLPSAAYSLGLGTLVLKSALDQPLSAEIELISPSSKELRTLKASLASRDEFSRAGIERPASLLNIRYEMFDRGGRHYLRLTTDEPFREPFLQFLINVEYSGGKLVREYSTLVDPPQWLANNAPVVAPAPTAIEAPAVVAEQSLPPATEPAAAAESLPPAAVAQTEIPVPVPSIESATPAEPAAVVEQQAPVEVPAEQAVAGDPAVAPDVAATPDASVIPESAVVADVPAVEAAPGDWASVGEYEVQRGDTLGAIAKHVRNDETVSIEQVVVALFNANPDAFFKDNVNNLRAGRVLRMPEREAVELVSPREARVQIAVHTAAWREYRAALAAASAPVEIPDALAVADASAAQAAAPSVTEKSAKTPAKPAASGAAEELLQIVRSSEPSTVPKAAGKPGSKSAGADLKTPATKTAPVSDKVATLEEAVAARELENKALQDRVGKAQEQIKNAQRLIELENKGLATAQKDASSKAAADAKTPAAGDGKAAEEPVAEAAAAAAATTKAKKPRKRVVPPPAPVEQPGFLASFAESITGNPVTLAALGGVVVLGGGIGALYALRRRKAKMDFEESILSAGSATTDAGASAEGSMPTAATDTSFLSDFSQGGMGNIHTDEVDPIAEAEVYLAYGRDEQAEEILKDAVVKDGKRHELRQKLAEIYFQRNDVRAFETVAEELYAALEGKGGKAWEKVEELGRKLAPQNPMFRPRNAEAVPAEEPAQFAMASQIAGGASQFGGDMSAQSFDSSATDSFAEAGNFDLGGATSDSLDAGSLDFQLDSPETTSTAKSDSNWSSPGSVEFSASEHDDRLVANSGNGAMGGDNSSNVLDFAPARAAASGETAPVAWDETATKLDLAKAYIDMGDAEGARSILDEVLSEGNDAQKKQAQDLARQIA